MDSGRQDVNSDISVSFRRKVSFAESKYPHSEGHIEVEVGSIPMRPFGFLNPRFPMNIVAVPANPETKPAIAP